MPSITDFRTLASFEDTDEIHLIAPPNRNPDGTTLGGSDHHYRLHTTHTAGMAGENLWPFTLGWEPTQDEPSAINHADDPVHIGGNPPDCVYNPNWGGDEGYVCNEMGNYGADGTGVTGHSPRFTSSPRPQIWTFAQYRLYANFPAGETLTWHADFAGRGGAQGDEYPTSDYDPGPITYSDPRYANLSAGKFTPEPWYWSDEYGDDDPWMQGLPYQWSAESGDGFGTAATSEEFDPLDYWDPAYPPLVPFWWMIIVAWEPYGEGNYFTPTPLDPSVGTVCLADTLELSWVNACRYAIYTPASSPGFSSVGGIITASGDVHWGVCVNVYRAKPEGGGYLPQIYSRTSG